VELTRFQRSFRILVTSENSGLVETINDAVSVHSIKKDAYARRAEDGTQVFTTFTLYDHFVNVRSPILSVNETKLTEEVNQIDLRPSRLVQVPQGAAGIHRVPCGVFGYLLHSPAEGPPQRKHSRRPGRAFDPFVFFLFPSFLFPSLAKNKADPPLERRADIDFGFMLSNSPGSLGFEMAPFKLPQDYIDILGGFDSPKFGEFRALFKRCFRDVRKHAERIITLVELMQKGAFFSSFSPSVSAFLPFQLSSPSPLPLSHPRRPRH